MVLMDRRHHRRGINQGSPTGHRPVKQPVVPYRPTDGERRQASPQPPREDEVVDAVRSEEFSALPHKLFESIGPSGVEHDLCREVHIPSPTCHENRPLGIRFTAEMKSPRRMMSALM